MEVKFPLDNRPTNRYLVSKVDKVYKNSDKECKNKQGSKNQRKNKNEKDEGFQILL